MTDDDFEPPPVPINSRAMVATLKRRIIEAIEGGKANDARTFLDIIERLSRLRWLDDKTPAERAQEEAHERAVVMADVDIRIARYLAAQRAQALVSEDDL